MESVVEDAVVVEDSEEVTLHCSIRGYHIVIWSIATKIKHAPVCERVHMMWVYTESIL